MDHLLGVVPVHLLRRSRIERIGDIGASADHSAPFMRLAI